MKSLSSYFPLTRTNKTYKSFIIFHTSINALIDTFIIKFFTHLNKENYKNEYSDIIILTVLYQNDNMSKLYYLLLDNIIMQKKVHLSPDKNWNKERKLKKQGQREVRKSSRMWCYRRKCLRKGRRHPQHRRCQGNKSDEGWRRSISIYH